MVSPSASLPLQRQTYSWRDCWDVVLALQPFIEPSRVALASQASFARRALRCSGNTCTRCNRRGPKLHTRAFLWQLRAETSAVTCKANGDRWTCASYLDPNSLEQKPKCPPNPELARTRLDPVHGIRMNLRATEDIVTGFMVIHPPYTVHVQRQLSLERHYTV